MEYEKIVTDSHLTGSIHSFLCTCTHTYTLCKQTLSDVSFLYILCVTTIHTSIYVQHSLFTATLQH